MHGRKQFLHLKYLHFSLLVCIFIKQILLGSKIISSERKQRIKSTDIMNKQQCQHTNARAELEITNSHFHETPTGIFIL